MISKSLWMFMVSVVSIVLVAVIYSHHGLLDLRKFHKQIEETKARVSLIEEENRSLKQQALLLENPSADLSERQVRTLLGWSRPSELIYFERGSERGSDPKGATPR